MTVNEALAGIQRVGGSDTRGDQMSLRTVGTCLDARLKKSESWTLRTEIVEDNGPEEKGRP